MPFNFDDSDPMDGLDAEEAPRVERLPSEEAEPIVPGAPPAEPTQWDHSAQVEKLGQYAEPDLESDEAFEAALGQVDRRMRIAQYFRSLLDYEFEGWNEPEAKMALARIRKFIRGELEVLFGMKEVAVPQQAQVLPFTSDEIAALKELVARLLKPTSPPVPKPRAVQIPAPPPPIQPRPPSPRPQLTQPALKPKPAAAPVPTKPSAVPAQVPTTKPTQRGVDLRIPLRYRDNPTARVINGKVFIQARDKETNELLWRTVDPDTRQPLAKRLPVLIDVTPTARPSGIHQPMPMPSIAQENMISEQRASEQLASLDKWAAINPALRQIGGAVVLSLLPSKGEDDGNN